MGASGFLGSHVTRQLVARGEETRVWVRPSSSSRAFADLGVQAHRGELDDDDELRDAMAGVDTVFYCVVDTRAWLRDPTPLFETNVEGLRHVLDAAVDSKVRRFVFCSTVGTIGVVDRGLADESTPHDWAHLGGPYIRSRLDAEDLVLTYTAERGLPAIVLCVSTTYGAPDFGSPHGRMVSDAALGKLPVYFAHAAMEVVGISDAAEAFVLAAEHGRIGERYIISESYMTWKELVTIAADAVGTHPPRFGIPLTVMKAVGIIGDGVGWLFRRDIVMNRVSVRLLHYMSRLDHGKATRELGWHPSPTSEAITEAARFYVARERAT